MFLPVTKVIYLLGLALLSIGVECVPIGYDVRRGLSRPAGGVTVYDVMKYGAIADGKTDSALAFIKAWNAACRSRGPAKLFIPKGTFSAGEVIFGGPCSASKPIIIEIQGTVLEDSDLSLYSTGVWITIEHVDGVLLTGGGTLNGQGEASWKYRSGGGSGTGSLLPVSLVWQNVNNSVMQNINLVNSKGFHMKVTDCTNMKISDLHISAPGNSPNTDGLHISDSINTTVTNSVIGTGDDCISIGDGNVGVAISKIFCGPGHGISVGSLGKRRGETDVKGVSVSNCTFTGTTNGARIKTYRASLPLQASNIVYDNIVMKDVKNPIIIDQNYNSKMKKAPSLVKISDVHFRNIRGTTISKIAVNLNCSTAIPCEGIELSNINLRPSSLKVGPLTSSYSNAKYFVKSSLNSLMTPFLH